MSSPSTDKSVDPNGPSHQTPTSESGMLRFDAQEYIGITEDDIVDYDTAEEYLLHFSRIGQFEFVKKLLYLKETKEIPLNIDCKGKHYLAILLYDLIDIHIFQAKVKPILDGVHYIYVAILGIPKSSKYCSIMVLMLIFKMKKGILR